MNTQDNIPSPFTNMLGVPDKMMEELKAMVKRYGYENFFIAVHKPEPPEQGNGCMWYPASDVQGDCLIETLEQTVGLMKEQKHNHG